MVKMLDGTIIEDISPELFHYGNYESNWYGLLDLDYMDSLTVKNVMRCVKNYAIGYCDGSRLSVRSKSDSYAVMFRKDGEEFWFHIQKWEFEAIEV